MQRIVRLVVISLVGSVLFSATYLVGFASGWFLKEAPVSASTRIVGEDAICGGAEVPKEFALFWEAWKIVQEDYHGQVPSGITVTHAAIGGMLDSLGDPYTYLVPPAEAQEESLGLSGLYEGIGTVVSEKDGHVVVVSPIEGSPAERAGIQAGDVILAVDGADISGLPLSEVVKLIRGPRGSRVLLTIQRPDQAQPLEFSIVRDRVRFPSVASRTLEGDLGYIRISYFSLTTGKELREALGKLKTARVKGLVLDLRNNPGGLLDPPTIEVASEFLREGVVLYEERTNRPEEAYTVRAGGQATDLPLVVLVNKGSASAAEIIAGALQTHGRAILIGEVTFGKGSVQSLHKLSDGSSLHITAGAWLTPDHQQIDHQGLTPDIEVPLSEEDRTAGRDPQLEQATQYLTEKLS